MSQITLQSNPRNTPTCVGKTCGQYDRGDDGWKHPHVRGEDMSTRRGSSRREETPPRAWGRQKGASLISGMSGNTPTCVGKTAFGNPTRNTGRKHPHVRGEDRADAILRVLPMETPPRAWGRPASCEHFRHRSGNTPTCVGKTHSMYRIQFLQ